MCPLSIYAYMTAPDLGIDTFTFIGPVFLTDALDDLLVFFSIVNGSTIL